MARFNSSKAALALAALLLAIPATAAADTLLVGNKGEDTVSFVDLASGAERARPATGKAPHEIAISPDGRQAAVVAYGGTTVDIFDIESASLVRRIDIAPEAAPHGIVWLRNGHLAIAAEKTRALVIADPRRGTSRAIKTDQAGSHMLAVSADQRTAYVSNVNAGTISIIDLRRGRKTGDIPVGGKPEGIAITRDGRELWVGDNSAPNLRVVDIASRRVVATLATDPVAIRVVISPDGATAVTSNIGAGTLSVFDVPARKSIGTIKVSGDLAAVQVTADFAPDGRKIYVAETARGVIAEVEMPSGKVLRRISAGKGADGLAISAVDTSR